MKFFRARNGAALFCRLWAVIVVPLLLHLGGLQVYTALHLATEAHFDVAPGDGRGTETDHEEEDPGHHHPHSAHDHEVKLVVAAPPPELPPVPHSQILRLEFLRSPEAILRDQMRPETRLRDPPPVA